MGFLTELVERLKRGRHKPPPKPISEGANLPEGLGLEFTGGSEDLSDSGSVLSHFTPNLFTGGDGAQDVIFATSVSRVYVLRLNNNWFKFNPTNQSIDNADLAAGYVRSASYDASRDRIYMVTSLFSLRGIAAWNPSTDTEAWSVDYTASAPISVGNSINHALYMGGGVDRIAAAVYQTDRKVFFVNPSTQAVVGSVATTKDALNLGFCPSNELLYVGMQGPGDVDVINPSSMTAVGTINTGAPSGVGGRPTFNPRDGFMYVPYAIGSGGGSVLVINPATNTLVTTIPVSAVGSGTFTKLVYRALDQRMYGCQFHDIISVISSTQEDFFLTSGLVSCNAGIDVGGFIYFFRGNSSFGTFCVYYRN